jgi:acyl-ACP thioesterase
MYKSVILPVVLYRCKTWSLTLREEHRLRVFENRGGGGKLVEVAGYWRRLHNEELRNFYVSPNIIREFKSRTTE